MERARVELGWGKFADKDLWTEVPSRYRIWLLDNCQSMLSPTLIEIVRTSLGLAVKAHDPKPCSLDGLLMERILERWERHMKPLTSEKVVECGLDVLRAVLQNSNSEVSIL